MANINIPFTPLPFQEYILNNFTHRQCLVIHRQAGKTFLNVFILIKGALESQKQYANFALIMPERMQCKKSSWNKFKEIAGGIPGIVFNETELHITFPHNNNKIYLLGCVNDENIRGLSFHGIVVDECQDILINTWEQVLAPTVSRTNGWSVFSGTPKGRGSNLLWKMYCLCKQEMEAGNPKFFSTIMSINNSGVYDDQPEKIEEIKKEISPAIFEQEMCCSWDGVSVSSYWGDAVREAINSRYDNYPYDPRFPVHTSFDLGMSDATSIWFFQIKSNGTVYFIDYEEDTDTTIPQWCERVLNKPYRFGRHFAPHDAKQRTFSGFVSETRADIAANYGIDFEIVPKPRSKLDYVESGRLLIERAYFNKDCPTMEKALVALSMCRPKYRLNSNQVESVVHDNYSHCQDAMMYASQGISDIEYYSSERKSIESYVTEYNPFD